MECPFKEGTEVSPTEREPSAVCVKQMTFTSWLRAPRQFRKIDKERVLGLWVMQEEYSRSSLVSGGLASGHISIHLGAGFFLKSLSKYFVNISNLIYLTLGRKTGRKCKNGCLWWGLLLCLVHVSVFPWHCALPPPSSLLPRHPLSFGLNIPEINSERASNHEPLTSGFSREGEKCPKMSPPRMRTNTRTVTLV